MGAEIFEFTHPIGPADSKIAVIAVTTASQHIDLTGANYTAIDAAIVAGRILTLQADGDVFYRWSSSTSGGTADQNMTAAGATPANQVAMLASGERRDERPPPGAQGIVLIGTVACNLRIYPSSKPLDEILRGV